MKLFAGWMFVLATGCIADGGAPVATGSGGGDSAHVDVRVTDAPGDFESVFVTVSRVEIGTADDSWVTLSDQPQRFDLLALQNDATMLLGGGDLAAGSYSQLRLIVDSSSVVVGGIEESLEVASGARTGIKINLDRDITAGMTYALVLDYNAARSIKSTGHGYLMTPVIELKSLTGTPAEPQDASVM